MNIFFIYFITVVAAALSFKDISGGCESQKCIDAANALSLKCEKEQDNVLGCICKVSDQDYWNKLSDCIQSCDTLQEVIDTSPNGLKLLYCVQGTGTETSAIGDVISTLSKLSESQKSLTSEASGSSKASDSKATDTKSSASKESDSSKASESALETTLSGSKTTSNFAAKMGCGTILSFLVLVFM